MFGYLCSSISHARRSLLSASKSTLPSHFQGYIRGFSSANWSLNVRNQSENVNANANASGRPNFLHDREDIDSRSASWSLNGRNQSENVNANANASGLPNFLRDREPNFLRDREDIGSRSANWSLNGRNQSENVNANANANASGRPDFLRDRENINPRSVNNAEIGEKSRQMDFVRGAIDEDEKRVTGGFLNNQYHYQHDADFVHIKMLRNNTFVTVTDSKGNVKLSGSAGSLKDLKSGQKLSKFAAEAIAEVVGRSSRGLGLKSVVMKVNGFTHFKRKKNAILSWKEGFMDSKGDKSPIVYIEDTTRRAHNGCRLPKNRRIKKKKK